MVLGPLGFSWAKFRFWSIRVSDRFWGSLGLGLGCRDLGFGLLGHLGLVADWVKGIWFGLGPAN